MLYCSHWGSCLGFDITLFILVVEDCPELRADMVLALTDKGKPKVYDASCQAEAKAALTTHPETIDAIFFGVELPDSDRKFCARL